jgi:hypothetical protein
MKFPLLKRGVGSSILELTDRFIVNGSEELPAGSTSTTMRILGQASARVTLPPGTVPDLEALAQEP